MNFRATFGWFRRVRALSRLRRLVLGAVISVLLLLLIFGDSVFSPARTIVLEAQTTGVTVTFKTATDTWQFPDAIVCKRRKRPDRNAERGDDPCDLRVYEAAETGALTLRWGADAKVDLSTDRLGQLRLQLHTDVADIPAKSHIMVSPESWVRAGALPFSGIAQVGAAMTSGQAQYLLAGRYEMRELGMVLAQVSGRTTHVVTEGRLTLGDFVRLTLTNGEDALVHGHLTPVDSRTMPAIMFVGVSEPGDTSLTINRYRLRNPVVLRPDWIDRATTNPLILAIMLILTLIVNTLPLWRLGGDEKAATSKT